MRKVVANMHGRFSIYTALKISQYNCYNTEEPMIDSLRDSQWQTKEETYKFYKNQLTKTGISGSKSCENMKVAVDLVTPCRRKLIMVTTASLAPSHDRPPLCILWLPTGTNALVSN